MLRVISEIGKSLSQLVRERKRMFPASGEINRKLSSEKGGAKSALTRVEARYKLPATCANCTDGLSMELAYLRWNITASNTEPLVPVNVESRGD